MANPELLSLGGRKFYGLGDASPPVVLDLYLMGHARHAGLQGAQLREGETPEAFAQRLLASMLASGRALLLLGGFLIPEGTKLEDWSEELAHETAHHLGRIQDRQQKGILYDQLLALVLAFFEDGLGSWLTTGQSSGESETGESATNQNGETTGSENGESSSGQSQEETTAEPARS